MNGVRVLSGPDADCLGSCTRKQATGAGPTLFLLGERSLREVDGAGEGGGLVHGLHELGLGL